MECAMNEQTVALDQADEEILTDTVSDEALEVAAGTKRGANSSRDTLYCFSVGCFCP
jgi:hypothetical protein